MAIVAMFEESRTTAYRQKLAALLRRPSCEWMAFSIGTAPVHRGFFAEVAAAIEGLPTGARQERAGVSHRQVQYGVRLAIGSQAPGQASYDPARRLLSVADEGDLDHLDGQAVLVAACVRFGLDIKGRNLQPLDTESAAHVAAHLYRLFENVADEDGEAELEALFREFAPAAESEQAFYAVAMDIVSHHRATCLAALRAHHTLAPGSFMKIVGTKPRQRMHAALAPAGANQDRRSARPRAIAELRPVRFLALQQLSPRAA